MTRPPRRHLRVTRDLVLFACGLAGVVYETILEQADRPYLLALFAGMLGLPAILGRDDQPPPPPPDAPSPNGQHRA